MKTAKFMRSLSLVFVAFIVFFAIFLSSCQTDLEWNNGDDTSDSLETKHNDVSGVDSPFKPLSYIANDALNTPHNSYALLLYRLLPDYNTDDSKFEKYYSEYVEKYGLGLLERNRPENDPYLTYYMVQNMGYSGSELRESFKSVVFKIGLAYPVPEDIYRGLLTKDINEALYLLKADTAFYHDGALYTFYDVFNMSEGGKKEYPFDVTKEEYDDEWNAIYYALYNEPRSIGQEGERATEIRSFFEPHIARVESRKSEETTSTPETTSPPVTTEFVPLPLEREDGMNFGYPFFYNALYQYLP